MTLRAKIKVFACALPAVMAVGEAGANDFDGSQNLICATIDTVHCESDGSCIQGRARDVNMPHFFRLNFEDMTVRRKIGEEGERTSAIASMKNDEGHLILQGADLGMGWSLLVSAETGQMTVTASDDGVAFIVFGACTPD